MREISWLSESGYREAPGYHGRRSHLPVAPRWVSLRVARAWPMRIGFGPGPVLERAAAESERWLVTCA
jgi:hypothetical protein